MGLKLKKWDPAEWLDNDEIVAEYLQASFESGDMREIIGALNDVARARNIDLAAQMGISRQGLYKTLSANSNPEFSTIHKLIEALGLQMSVVVPRTAFTKKRVSR